MSKLLIVRLLFRWMLLLVEAFFLNVLLPGHTRGSIQLPGTGPRQACCQGVERHNSDKPSSDSGESSRSKRNSAINCAICSFAARLTVPVAADLAPTRMGLLARLSPQMAREMASVPQIATYLGRGPPLALMHLSESV